MTSPPPAPLLSPRDRTILDALRAGHGIDRVTEVGVYRGSRTTPAWTRADVERVAAKHHPEALPPTGDRPGRAKRRPPTPPAWPTVPWQPPPAEPGQPRQVVVTALRAEALTLLCEGLDYATIATRLQVTDSAAKERVRKAVRAIGARDRAHATVLLLTGRIVVKVAQPPADHLEDVAS